MAWDMPMGLGVMSAPRTLEPEGEWFCVRPIIREATRKSLVESNQSELANRLYLCHSSEEDVCLINSSRVGREVWHIVQTIMNEKKDTLTDALADLVEWGDSADDTVRSMRAMVRLLMREPSLGRVFALLAFSGWAAVKLSAEHEEAFVRTVMQALEDESHKEVKHWIKNGGGQEEIRQRFEQAQQKKEQRSQNQRTVKDSSLAKMACITGGALLIGFVLARS